MQHRCGPYTGSILASQMIRLPGLEIEFETECNLCKQRLIPDDTLERKVTASTLGNVLPYPRSAGLARLKITPQFTVT